MFHSVQNINNTQGNARILSKADTNIEGIADYRALAVNAIHLDGWLQSVHPSLYE